jgi:hypothetical protein
MAKGVEMKQFWLALILIFLTGCAGTNADQSARCVAASAAQIATINAGIKVVDVGNSVQAGWYVKSKDFSNVYMVSARILGAGMDKQITAGVWAIGGTPDQPGMTLSVDGMARNFSAYPDASKTDAKITLSADGVSIAKGCVESK